MIEEPTAATAAVAAGLAREAGAFEQLVGELDVGETPSGAGAARPSWIACAKGLGSGVGPAPRAEASAVTPMPTPTTMPQSNSRRLRGMRRRKFNVRLCSAGRSDHHDSRSP